MKKLEDLGYTKEEIEVFPYGVNIKVEKGCEGVNIGYEEICAIKFEMESKQTFSEQTKVPSELTIRLKGADYVLREIDAIMEAMNKEERKSFGATTWTIQAMIASALEGRVEIEE